LAEHSLGTTVAVSDNRLRRCARLVAVKILFAVTPGYGLMLPIVPLMWAARAAGHEILVATTSEMTGVGARAGLPVVDVFRSVMSGQSC